MVTMMAGLFHKRSTEHLSVMAQAITEQRTPSLQTYLVLGMGVMAVSLAAIFIRLAQAEEVPSLFIAAGRLIIAALLLTPATLRNPCYVDHVRKLTRQDWLLLITSGVFLAIHFAAWVSSLESTTVLISVVLVTTTPIWVALLEVTFLRTRLSQMVIGGLVIALIGGAIIGTADLGETTVSNGDGTTGAILAIIGAIAVAVYLVIGRKVRAQLPLTPYIWLVYGIAAICLSFVILITQTSITGYSLVGYSWVLALALIPQLIGHSSFNYTLAYLPATYVSVATQSEPVLSALVAYFVFTELPSEGQILGGVVIMVGVLLASLGQSNRSK